MPIIGCITAWPPHPRQGSRTDLAAHAIGILPQGSEIQIVSIASSDVATNRRFNYVICFAGGDHGRCHCR